MFKLLKLLILVVIVVGAGAMFLPLGSVAYKDPQMAGTLVVPALAMYEGESVEADGYTAKFQTVRTEWALKQEFERMLAEKYTEKVCSDGATGYYDAENQTILRTYTIEQGTPFSSFTVHYSIGSC